MGKQFDNLSDTHIAFIEEQHLFFVGSAGSEGFVNVSPKGKDSLRVTGPNEVIWLNLTGSGNETAAHMLENSRMTLMFCSFTEKPMILRVFGDAEVIHPRDAQWPELLQLFPAHSGRRQVFRLKVNMVQTSCGFAVPFMHFVGERDTLEKALKKKEESGIENYWREKNSLSLDGKNTGIEGDI